MKTAICTILTASMLAGCQSTQTDTALTLPPASVTVRVDHRSDLEHEAADRTTELAMRRSITLNAKNLPLASLIHSLQDSTGVNLATHWEALELVGVDRDSMVSIQVEDLPAAQLLSMALKQVNADVFDDDRVSFAVIDGVVVISTIRELTQYTQVRVYDVNWFIRPSTPLPEGWDAAYQGSTTRINQNDPPLCLTGPTPEQSEYVISRQERIDQIIEMIITIFGEEDYWTEEKYAIHEFDGLIVVKTTRELHLEIEALLNTLHVSHVRSLKQQAKFREATVLLEQAQALKIAGNDRRALHTVERALRIDPNNLNAQALHQVIVEAMQD